MASWAGFSDEDLRKVKTSTDTKAQGNNRKNPENLKKVSFGQDRHGKSGQDRHKDSKRCTTTNTKQTDIDPSMKLQTTHQQNEGTSGGHKKPKEKREEKPVDMSDVNKFNTEQPVNTSEQLPELSAENQIEELDDKVALERDLKSLDKFRTQQKAIEEANNQKKALLSKTLSERKQRAKKEAYKLEHIQKELSKLDTLLTADVQVIRNKIDDASRDFMDAQRRFERAEIEYIASKVDVHTKSELKEQLTDHLYTIIHQNEVRKAKKLADLMSELDMEDLEEDFSLPELPPLSSFQPSTVTVSPTGSTPFLIKSSSNDPENLTVSQQEVKNSNNVTVEHDPESAGNPLMEDAETQSGNTSTPQPVQDKEISNTSVLDDTGQSVGSPTDKRGETDLTTNTDEHKHEDNDVSCSRKSKQDNDMCSPDVDLSGKTIENGDTISNAVEKVIEKAIPASWLFRSNES